jgi:hypothetical protein
VTAAEAVEKIVGVLHEVDGLRPATPESAWLPSSTAVGVSAERIEIRLVATRLPLPPLLDRAAEAVRSVLAGTEWENARLRLVVTDLDGAAFGRG